MDPGHVRVQDAAELTAVPSSFFILMIRRPPTSPLFPYTTLFRSQQHQSVFKKSWPLIFWALVFGCVFFLFLQARRKMQAQPEFALQKRKRLPLFFWQAVFILLPVAGLAGFGLYSLRQDRMLAEQEARESGEILAQRLAQAIGTEAAQSLRDY